ncbi:MerR family transcriptional regulator [Streptomyces formicae]|uniref:MerR family transcriptional regulator n=1 Tax=Streptomyces formicae TaxID=1616117 RepID=A0ABY3WFM4_9ACTN|nr:MerR family transcriptional regulator [Streptomyces formicae]UNM10254.1 MerR family transcriptional regulator [Streptomyces formicae]
MNADHSRRQPPGLFTIGQLSRRTGMPVRTIRYWSDIGALPPTDRSSGGYRLYDAASVARLELLRTLRELGLGLDDVRRVLERETTVADVAVDHIKALDAQIKGLRLRRAVLATIAAGRRPPTEEMTLLNKLARLSAEERRRIIDDFLDEVFGGLDLDPQLRDRMTDIRAELPDDPTAAQVDAWVELAELVADPEFRQRLRSVARSGAAGRAEAGPGREPGAYLFFVRKVVGMVGEARAAGIAPDAPEAAGVLDRLLGPADRVRRAEVLARVEDAGNAQMERYRQLVAAVNGEPARPSHAEEFAWLAAALRAHS